METYLQFNPASTIRVEEQVSVVDNRAFLRHIPKKGSVVIDGFTEVDGAPQANQFYCDYATDSLYRDANRVLHFGSVDDYTFVTVNYIAIGTVVTADDMNEIKAHLENDSIHDYQLPTMAPTVKGGAKVGANLYMTGDTLNADSGFFRFFNFDIRGTEIKSLDLFRVEESYFNSFVDNTNSFDEVLKNHGWEPQYGDIVSVSNGRDYPAVLYRDSQGYWHLLGGNRAGWSDWNQKVPLLTIFDKCFLDYIRTVLIADATSEYKWYDPRNWSPYTYMDTHWNFILTKADRKLLDYLHAQLDDQLD